MADKLYKNFRGKQNKGYVLAMEKQPIARNNRLDSSTIASVLADLDPLTELSKNIILNVFVEIDNTLRFSAY